ncbi:MAG: protein-export chaperone SecB [Pseudomonadota bacterium]|nr:protein-export chaperone SecB [Pseudomonadota bacterium]
MAKKKEEAKETPKATFQLVHQYAKDVSAECFVSKSAFEGEMQTSLDVGLATKPLKDDTYEVLLKLRCEGKVGDKPVYLVETEYVGEYLLTNIDDERKEALLAIDGASLVFPFARQVIMNGVTSLGYQPRMIEPIHFAGLYMHNKQMQAKQAAEAQSVDKKKLNA